MNPGIRSSLWSLAAFVLLLFLLVPVLNIFSVLLLVLPFTVLYATLTPGRFALYAALPLVAAALIVGAGLLLVGLFFVAPGIVLGHMYRKKAQARTVLTVVTLVFLVQFLLQLLLFSAVLNISLLGEIGEAVRSLAADLQAQGFNAPGVTDQASVEALIRLMLQMVPMMLITISLVLAVVGHALARQVLRHWHGLEVAGLEPAHKWMLPKVLVFYYVVALLLDLLTMNGEQGTFLDVVLVNMIPLLRLVFAIQAVGFFFYLAYQKKWNRTIPILLSIPVFLFPPLSLIGVLDLVFPIRKAFAKR